MPVFSKKFLEEKKIIEKLQQEVHDLSIQHVELKKINTSLKSRLNQIMHLKAPEKTQNPQVNAKPKSSILHQKHMSAQQPKASPMGALVQKASDILSSVSKLPPKKEDLKERIKMLTAENEKLLQENSELNNKTRKITTPK